jgi:hypothetical protein
MLTYKHKLYVNLPTQTICQPTNRNYMFEPAGSKFPSRERALGGNPQARTLAKLTRPIAGQLRPGKNRFLWEKSVWGPRSPIHSPTQITQLIIHQNMIDHNYNVTVDNKTDIKISPVIRQTLTPTTKDIPP